MLSESRKIPEELGQRIYEFAQDNIGKCQHAKIVFIDWQQFARKRGHTGATGTEERTKLCTLLQFRMRCFNVRGKFEEAARHHWSLFK